MADLTALMAAKAGFVIYLFPFFRACELTLFSPYQEMGG